MSREKELEVANSKRTIILQIIADGAVNGGINKEEIKIAVGFDEQNVGDILRKGKRDGILHLPAGRYLLSGHGDLFALGPGIYQFRIVR